MPQGFLTVRRGGAGWGRAAGVSYCKKGWGGVGACRRGFLL